jgi:gamma-glutamylcyclotransferase (GGCT)/AIG2-like uncharacterized protein YtfP
MDADQRLFVYGSLVDPRCLDEVLGRKHLGERLSATLDGYRRVTSTSYEYPYIVEASEERVRGVLILDLNADDIQVLDRYEEVDTGVYRRQIVEVQAWGCGPRPMRLGAFTYVAGPTLRASTAI